MKKKQRDDLLKSIKDVFDAQYKRLYLELLQTIQDIYRTWRFQFNNPAQRRFYALLYLFVNCCGCYDAENDEYSDELEKYLNFFCFFWTDQKYYVWYGFQIDDADCAELSLLFRTLKEINTRAIKLTAFMLPNLKKWLRLADYQEVKTLFWGFDVNAVADLYPIYVLDDFAATDLDFAEYYLGQEKVIRDPYGSIEKNRYLLLSATYKKLNQAVNADNNISYVLRELDEAKSEIINYAGLAGSRYGTN